MSGTTPSPHPISRRAVAGTAGTLAAAAAAVALTASGALGGSTVVVRSTPVSDLGTAVAEGLADAQATLVLSPRDRRADGTTSAVLTVRGIDRSQAGRVYGAHLHVGPCVAGDGAAAGAHYNHDVAAGRVPVRVDPTTEIWLDLEVTAGGTARSAARVPFVAQGGQRSVVIHRLPTDAAGAAGPRVACLPVSW